MSHSVLLVVLPLEPAVQRLILLSFANLPPLLRLLPRLQSDLQSLLRLCFLFFLFFFVSSQANSGFLWGLLSAPPPGPITPAADQPTYTFIDHDNDLRSKKIRSPSSRKAIRSHVMRDVRRRERLAGLKRGTKRDTQEKRPQPKVASKPVEDSSTERTSACWTTSPSSSSTSSSSSTIEEIEAGNELVRSQLTWQQQEDQHQQLQQQQLMTGSANLSTTSSPVSIAQPNTTTWFPVPQRPMKSADCIPTVVADLIYYCKSRRPYSLSCVSM